MIKHFSILIIAIFTLNQFANAYDPSLTVNKNLVQKIVQNEVFKNITDIKEKQKLIDDDLNKLEDAFSKMDESTFSILKEHFLSEQDKSSEKAAEMIAKYPELSDALAQNASEEDSLLYSSKELLQNELYKVNNQVKMDIAATKLEDIKQTVKVMKEKSKISENVKLALVIIITIIVIAAIFAVSIGIAIAVGASTAGIAKAALIAAVIAGGGGYGAYSGSNFLIVVVKK